MFSPLDPLTIWLVDWSVYLFRFGSILSVGLSRGYRSSWAPQVQASTVPWFLRLDNGRVESPFVFRACHMEEW